MSSISPFFHRECIITADGSHTLYLPQYNEHYHSVHGAIQESSHVFIKEGMNKLDHDIDPVHVLEVGFGTGLNAFLCLQDALTTGKKIEYHAIEPFPLTMTEAGALNLPGLLADGLHTDDFLAMHRAPFLQMLTIRHAFVLKKYKVNIEDVELPKQYFELVFFDAFAPHVQPDIWTEAVFSGIYKAMKPGGTLTTYCAKGSVKRALRACGFRLSHPPGPAGKREMTRAIKPN